MSLFFLNEREAALLLHAVAPNCKEPDLWAAHLSRAMHRFGIMDDAESVAAFIAQLLVESAELNRVTEDLNYRAERLMVVWPKRFPTIAVAQRYAHSPRDLANYVYSNRMGNGPPESDDGWNFRGRGPIQMTGRRNYKKLNDVLGIPILSHPKLLEEKGPGALAAAWFWWGHRLSFLAADLPDDNQDADFVTITRVINGGVHGLARRQTFRRLIRSHLGLPEEQ